MTNKTRLKPCPFCGGAAKEHDRFNANVITCRGCGVKVRQSAMGQGNAAEIWNRRAAPETFISVRPSDEEIDRIASMMPDGAGGMLTQWGYRQFARQVISSCIAPNDPEPVGFFNGKFGGDVNGNMWFTVKAYGAIPAAGAKIYTAPVAAQPGAPDGDIVDSQERILDAAKHWAEQRDIGPAYAKAAWSNFQMRAKAELNYIWAIASDPQEEASEEFSDDPAGHLLSEAYKYWKHANAKHYGAVQWICHEESGALLIYTRGEYLETLMQNVSACGAHPDDVAVQAFAGAMKAKMARKRNEGRGGWQDKGQCSAEWLSELLRGHIGKGDPVDVANLAMMLHQRGERITLGNVFSSELSAEPIFWYRPRSDGGYEGPLHNESIEEVRKRSGAWVPLFAGAAPSIKTDGK